MGKAVAREPECRRERHSVDVPGWAAAGPVEVAMRVDPHDPSRLAARLAGRPGCRARSSGRLRVRGAPTTRRRRRRRARRAARTPRGSRAGTAPARPAPPAPPARVPRCCLCRQPRSRTTSDAPRGPRSGSRTAPCRRRDALARGRAARPRSSRSSRSRPRSGRLPGLGAAARRRSDTRHAWPSSARRCDGTTSGSRRGSSRGWSPRRLRPRHDPLDRARRPARRARRSATRCP